MAEKVLDKKGQKTPTKGGNTGGQRPQDKGGHPEASKKGNDGKKR